MELMYILIFILILIVIALCFIMIARSRLQQKNGVNSLKKREQELIHKRPYAYYQIIVNPFILIASSIFLVYPLMKSIEKSSQNSTFYIAQIIGLVIICLFNVFLIYDLIKNIKLQLLYKNISSLGEKTDGIITNYCANIIRYRFSHYNYIFPNYHLVIKYYNIYSNEEEIMLTPKLSFNPQLTLGTNKCDVFFYKNTVIAGGFRSYLDTNSEPLCLQKDNKYLNNYDNVYKIIAILMLVIAVVFILYNFLTAL